MSASIFSPLRPLHLRKDATLLWSLSEAGGPARIALHRNNANGTFRVIPMAKSGKLFELLDSCGVADIDFDSRGAALAAIYAVTKLDPAKIKLQRRGYRRGGHWLTANNTFLLVRDKVAPEEKAAWFILPVDGKSCLTAVALLKKSNISGKYFVTRKEALQALQLAIKEEQVSE